MGGMCLTVGFWAALVTPPGPAAPWKERALTRQVEAYLRERDFHGKVWDTIKEWKDLPLHDRSRLVELLSAHLEDTAKTGVKVSGEAIIPYRYKTGDLKPWGHGYYVIQDVFIVGGKAAFAIQELVGFYLPEINEGLSKRECARCAAEIRRYVQAFRRMTPFLAADDYRVLTRTLREWQALPPLDRAALTRVLAGQLGDSWKVGLRNNDEMIVASRPLPPGRKSEDLKKFTAQDVFIVGGKAAWAIEELTGETLPGLTAKWPTDQERHDLIYQIETQVRFYEAGVRHGSTARDPGK